ncbi:MAG: endonuclease domain-containing protein [Nitrospirota bacterium]
MVETKRRAQHDFARTLRRNQTDVERVLWRNLRSRQFQGLKFRRQHPIGPYIVDFCCPERFVVIELDGGHHSDQEQADRQRTAFLEAKGFRVLRYWDNDVMRNLGGVLEDIGQAMSNPHPGPLPRRARGKG